MLTVITPAVAGAYILQATAMATTSTMATTSHTTSTDMTSTDMAATTVDMVDTAPHTTTTVTDHTLDTGYYNGGAPYYGGYNGGYNYGGPSYGHEGEF